MKETIKTTIATHNGNFHADDAMACAILGMIHPTATVTRTRDPKEIENSDIAVDVGGIYDPEKKRFDHHQRDFSQKRENSLPYASAGLVWRAYGERLVGEKVAEIIDRVLIAPIDAADSGYALWDQGQAVAPYTVSHLISSLNPGWNEEQNFDGLFDSAVKMSEKILAREIERAIGRVKAENVVRKAVDKSKDGIVILDVFVPWQEYVGEDSVFVVFPGTNDDWRIQCVPTAPGSFDKKKSLPETWAGLRGDELAKVTGVKDTVFCHPGRFIAGTKSRKGAIQLAKIANK